MVEHSLAKAEVEGSSPSFRSWLRRLVVTSRVGIASRSNPSFPGLPNTHTLDTKETSRHREERDLKSGSPRSPSPWTWTGRERWTRTTFYNLRTQLEMEFHHLNNSIESSVTGSIQGKVHQKWKGHSPPYPFLDPSFHEFVVTFSFKDWKLFVLWRLPTSLSY